MDGVYKRRRAAADARSAKRAKTDDAPEEVTLEEADHDTLMAAVVEDGGFLPYVPHGAVADRSHHSRAGWCLPPATPFDAARVLEWLATMEDAPACMADDAVALCNVYHHAHMGARGKVFTLTPCEGGCLVQAFNRSSRVTWRGGVVDATAVPHAIMHALVQHHCAAPPAAMQVVCSTKAAARAWVAAIHAGAPKGTDVQVIGAGPSMSNSRPFVHRPGELQFCVTTLKELVAQPLRCPDMEVERMDFDYGVQCKFARVVVFTSAGLASVRSFHRFLVHFWGRAAKFLVLTAGDVADQNDARSALEVIDARVVNRRGEPTHDHTDLTGAGMAAVFSAAYRRYLRPTRLRLSVYRHAVAMPSAARVLAGTADKSLAALRDDGARFTGTTVAALVDAMGLRRVPRGAVSQFVAREHGVRVTEGHARDALAQLTGDKALKCDVCMARYAPPHMVVRPCLHYTCLPCTLKMCGDAFEQEAVRCMGCHMCRCVATFGQLFVCGRARPTPDPRDAVEARLQATGKGLALGAEARLCDACAGEGCDTCHGHIKSAAWGLTGFTDADIALWSLVVVTKAPRAVPAIVAAAQRDGVYRLHVHVVDWAGEDSEYEHGVGDRPSPQQRVHAFCEKWDVRVRDAAQCAGDCTAACKPGHV